MKFRHSTLVKYVVSYILILAVAFVGFYSVVRFHLQREYLTAYRTETEAKIQNMSKVLNQNFSDILMMNYVIENNMSFINVRYSKRSYTRYLAVSELKNLAMTNGLVKDIVYFDIQNDDVLAANSTLFFRDGKYFIKTISGDLCIPHELVYGKDAENTVSVLSREDTSLYLFPGPKNSSKYRTVFLINEKQLYELINLYATQEIEAVGLVSGDKIVFSTGTGSFSDVENPASMARASFLAAGEDSELYITDIGALQISMIVQVDTHYFSDYATNAFERSYVIMVIFLGLGVLLMLLALKTTYLPLHNLVRRITKKNSYIGNEILALGHAFDETLNEKESLEAKIDNYRTMVKQAIRPSLVSHSISDEQIDRLFHEDFHGAVAVAILSLPQMNMQITWESYPPPSQWLLVTLDPAAGQHTILIGIPDFNDSHIPLVNTYLHGIAKEFSCSISYSNFSSNPLEIARLYDMAKRAQTYCTNAAVTSYASIQHFCEDAPAAAYPYQTFDDLAVCLRQLNFRKAHENINEIIQITTSYPHVVIRCICMDILTLINTSMHANSIRFDLYDTLFLETLQLCRSPLSPDTRKTILNNMLAILSIFEQEILNTGLQLPQVTKFVEENCYHTEFSLAYLADHFGVNSVYMSTFFTKRMKTTLTDYVWELRLQRAKYLLETTDEPIDKISLNVGYDIPSSFRRKFKQELGITPSEYRRQIK